MGRLSSNEDERPILNLLSLVLKQSLNNIKHNKLNSYSNAPYVMEQLREAI